MCRIPPCDLSAAADASEAPCIGMTFHGSAGLEKSLLGSALGDRNKQWLSVHVWKRPEE